VDRNGNCTATALQPGDDDSGLSSSRQDARGLLPGDRLESQYMELDAKDENPECYCQNRKEKWQKRKMLDEQK